MQQYINLTKNDVNFLLFLLKNDQSFRAQTIKRKLTKEVVEVYSGR